MIYDSINSRKKRTSNSKFVKEVIRVGDDLISKYIDTSFRDICSVSEDISDINEELNALESIDNGIGGLPSFFLELYLLTNDPKYLQAGKESISWILKYVKENDSKDYSFFNGRGSLLYQLVQFYKVVKDKYYLEAAESLIMSRSFDMYIYSKYTSDFLFDGRTGTLLALVHLFDASQSNKVMSYINKIIDIIVENAFCSSAGMYWKRKDQTYIKPINSFCYGTAGIGFVFAEIGRYFDNPAFKYIAKEANKYVDSTWDKKINNWPDFRKDIHDTDELVKYLELYKSGNTSSLETPGDNLSWQHGLIGITLSKLGINELSKSNLDLIMSKLQSELLDGKQDKSIIDLTSAGILMIELYNCFKEQVFLEKAYDIAEQCSRIEPSISCYKILQNSHINKAYFYTKLIGDEEFNSTIFLPKLPFSDSSPKGIVPDLNFSELRRIIINKSFQRTLLVMEAKSKEKVSKFFSEEAGQNVDIQGFLDFADVFISNNSNSPEIIERLKDVLNLEKEVLSFSNQLTNTFYLRIKEIVHYKNINKYLNKPDDLFGQSILKIPEDIAIIPTKWDWTDPHDGTGFKYEFRIRRNLRTPRSGLNNDAALLFNSQDHVSEYTLNFINIILYRFRQPSKVEKIIEEVKRFCETQKLEFLREMIMASGLSTKEKFMDRLDFILLSKIKYLLYEGILVIENDR